MNTPNPYASPSEDAQHHHSVKFTLDDEQRRIITSTATVMIVAGIVSVITTLIDVVRAGKEILSIDGVIAALLGAVGCFVIVAGFSLRKAAELGSVEALLAGFRQLFVVFLVKGVSLLLVVGMGLLTLLMFVLGMGRGLFT